MGRPKELKDLFGLKLTGLVVDWGSRLRLSQTDARAAWAPAGGN